MSRRSLVTLIFALATAAFALPALTAPQPLTWGLLDVAAVPGDATLIAPRYSPDGLRLLASGPNYTGLYLVTLGQGDLLTLSGDARAGVFARFAPNGLAVDYRTPLADGEVTVRVGLDGMRSRGTLDPAESRHPTMPLVATVRGHEIAVIKDNIATVISPPGDKFYGPQFSPDGRNIIYQGLASGIWLHNLESGARRRIGAGNHPCWMPDGSALLFDISEDDGAVLISSELAAFDLRAMRKFNLTRTADRLEQRPAAAPNGGTIAFDDGQRLYVARLTRPPVP